MKSFTAQLSMTLAIKYYNNIWIIHLFVLQSPGEPYVWSGIRVSSNDYSNFSNFLFSALWVLMLSRNTGTGLAYCLDGGVHEQIMCMDFDSGMVQKTQHYHLQTIWYWVPIIPVLIMSGLKKTCSIFVEEKRASLHLVWRDRTVPTLQSWLNNHFTQILNNEE